MSARRHIGLDVGGTSLKGGVLDDEGNVLASASRPTHASGGDPERLLDLMAALVRELAGGSALQHLGVGVPGLVERRYGRVETSPNLPELEGVALADGLARRLELPRKALAIDNDANLAALGEAWCGAMAGVESGLMVTLGTGVGGGFVLHGRVFHGEGMAGEVGHVIVDPNGLTCPCGSRGCLETLASATAASRRAREAGLPRAAPGDLERLTEIALAGPGPEAELYRAVGLDLGRGLAAVVTLLDVRTFVIGGGLSAAFAALEPGIQAGIRERSFGERVHAIRVLEALLGNDAGWIGAARLAALDGGDG